MADVPTLLSYLATSQFFQLELFALLASLILSLTTSNSFPFFVASAVCVIATSGSLILESFSGLIGLFAYTECTTTLTLTALLLVTFIHSLVKGLPLQELRFHAATTLGFSLYLAIRAFRIFEDSIRPIDLDVDRSSLEAAGFAAMHLLSTMLMLLDRTFFYPPKTEIEPDEKVSMV